VKLNDDDFPDIVIHNWLTNEMVFYYGMGELQFAEQNILSFGQDTVAVVFGDFNNDHILDYAIASSATKTLRFFAGDGMATYFQYQSLDYNHSIGELVSASISSRTSSDIVAVDDRGGHSVFSQIKATGRFTTTLCSGARRMRERRSLVILTMMGGMTYSLSTRRTAR